MSLPQLTAAVDLYNEGVAELDAGNTDGQAKVDQAKGQIDAICSTAGFTDTTACLAQFGLELSPLPPAAESSDVDVVGSHVVGNVGTVRRAADQRDAERQRKR